MVVVLTQREPEVSPHIIFEATLCLQARKPLLVFVEDVLSVDRIPPRVLRSRFSRRWFFRQIRDHRQSVRLFRSYLGDDPPPRYQPSASRQTCLAIGLSVLQPPVRDSLVNAVGSYGYNVVAGRLSDRVQDQSVELSEYLACADLAVEILDSPDPSDQYFMGAIRGTFLPRISLTSEPQYPYDDRVPREYQPSIVSAIDSPATLSVLATQFELYEQAFVELDTPEEVTRYVDLLLNAANPFGEYERTTRNIFIKELNMGDQYKVGQAGAVGPNAHAHDMTFQQVWNEAAGKIDLDALAGDLARLRSALKAEAKSPEEDAAVGSIALAEVAAKEKDGPKALAHLKAAGHWALEIAEKIGVAVAAGAIKAGMGL